jgi:hypothetical protein
MTDDSEVAGREELRGICWLALMFCRGHVGSRGDRAWQREELPMTRLPRKSPVEIRPLAHRVTPHVPHPHLVSRPNGGPLEETQAAIRCRTW